MSTSSDGTASVVGLVLGAGASSRLGRPKQTLPFGVSTVLGWAVRTAEESSLERVVLVVGGAAGEALAGLQLGRTTVVRNTDYGEGCATSLAAGLDATGACDAAMLLLGDVPGLGAEAVDTVRSAWEARRPWGLVTEYEDGPGHPFVFAARAFDALRGLHADKAVWKLLDSEQERIEHVPLARPRPLDVDTWDDYESVLAALTST
jgi:molybdenum cofactor cytidylyltransferase